VSDTVDPAHGAPLLAVQALRKEYASGIVRRRVTFSLEADLSVSTPAIVGVMGPNGSGKTTLFELITGSNLPTAGRVLVAGRDIHRVRYRERDRLAIHYHQSYQVRRFKRTMPAFLLGRAGTEYPLVHLFDEPQFNTQDGYIGFMLDFFRKLRSDGRVVFLCLHPTEPFHLRILRETCERFVFVNGGRITEAASIDALAAHDAVRSYLGRVPH
jgi:ABC-type multidrug transport system ATPase subunit